MISTRTRHPALTTDILNAACIDAAQCTYRELGRLTLTSEERAAYMQAFWLASSAWVSANHTKRGHNR